MTDSITRPIDPRARIRFEQFSALSQYFILAYLAIAVVVMVLAPILAIQW
ncbi:MAG: hypothetical protein HGA86_03670, partial [Anaerolineaceae bacterium]|nr:hypothetical protein [Anaerolineaceae bacterium]